MKVGDYVRTETGQIGKITYFEGDMARVDCDKFITYKSNHNEITKISPNIIDLIEVGDYVNGHKVFKKEEYQIRVEDRENTWGIAILDETDIKSIVTKEQFESIKYEVN